MTHLEQAIKDAVEKGYDYNAEIPPFHPEMCEILLDSAFWKALGKARGWEASVCKLCGEIGFCDHSNCPRIFPWKYHWHRLIDHLAEGKDVESFFAGL